MARTRDLGDGEHFEERVEGDVRIRLLAGAVHEDHNLAQETHILAR